MAEEPAPMSLADRIAALNLSQTSKAPSHPPPSYEQATKVTMGHKPRGPAPPPPRPALPARPQTASVPRVVDHVGNQGIGNLPETERPAFHASRPPLPARTPTQNSQGPALPPRRPSEQSQPELPPRRPSAAFSETPSQRDYGRSRRGSNESVSSIATIGTSFSGISDRTSMTSASERYRAVKAPDYDPSSLPSLPPKKSKEEREADARKYAGLRPLRQTKSTPKVEQSAQSAGTTPPPPARPAGMPLPTRPGVMPPPVRQAVLPPPAPARPRKSPLEMGMSQSTYVPPPIPTARPSSVPRDNGAVPPPIPASSKPDLSAFQATKPRSAAVSAPAASAPGSCLHCRDFSGPDNHAARFSREALPYHDVGWLAQQLTAPFPSATDKARAIFTWLHHNVAYDAAAFFGNAVKPSTPQKTLESGLAVCEGYAGLFTALAVKVGLESYVVGGASKGFGHTPLKPGESIRPFKSTHAWNVVKIDNGEWKLIDSCWGAGTISGETKAYTKGFAPQRFTQPNNDFGMDHFPEDHSKQFRTDGRVLTWEEFTFGNKDGCGAAFFSGFVAEEGLASTTFQPQAGKIVLAQQGPTVRFAFQKVCPHWNPVVCGKGPYYVYVLHLEGLDGTPRNHVPLDTNGDVWWSDVPLQDLGRPGQKASIWAVNSFDHKDGRGVTVDEYRRRKGRVAMSFGFACTWEIA